VVVLWTERSLPRRHSDTRNPRIRAHLEQGLLGIASGEQEVPIESCHALKVSSGTPTSHGQLICRDLLTLSSGEKDSMPLGVEYTRSMPWTPKPIGATNFDARSLLHATWRSEHKLKSM